jgi:hypothetical protein
VLRRKLTKCADPATQAGATESGVVRILARSDINGQHIFVVGKSELLHVVVSRGQLQYSASASRATAPTPSRAQRKDMTTVLLAALAGLLLLGAATGLYGLRTMAGIRDAIKTSGYGSGDDRDV